MTEPRRIIATVTRGWKNEVAIMRALQNLGAKLQRQGFGPGDIVLVHGANQDGDHIAEACAKHLGWQVEPHPIPKEYFKTYGGKVAPIMRNKDMVEKGAWCCAAFWDGQSGGAYDTLKRCVQAGIPVQITPQTSEKMNG